MAKRSKSRSKKRFNLFTIITLVFIAGVLGFITFKKIKDYFTEPDIENFKLYPGFGIYIPEDYEIHGIDVSRYQKKINWGLVKSMNDQGKKIGFAIIKSTEGISYKDPMFDRNWKHAKKNNVPRGAYHFFNAGKSGREQAENFIKHVQLEPGDLPPVLDIETLKNTSAETMQKNVSEWLVMIEDYYQVKPIIYSGASFYSNYLQTKFPDYPLWVAHYLQMKAPRTTNKNWYFWQHSETGNVNGIEAKVDFNVFYGDSSDFRNLLIK